MICLYEWDPVTWLGGLKTPLRVSQKGIDQGCDGRILPQNDQRAEEKRDSKDREQPEFFSFIYEGPEFHDKFAHRFSLIWLEMVFEV